MGGSNNGCPNEEDGVFEFTAGHEVWCCSDIYVEGYQQKNCGIWSTSKLLGQCYNVKTWPMAECVCRKYGGRLCTKDELERDCAKRTGCNHDVNVVWSSTHVNVADWW